MKLPPGIPLEKANTLTEMVNRLGAVTNVVAVVLGGSYASGLARPDSDLDIGIYYREAAPFAIDQLRSVAERICTPGSIPIITEVYGWGPWVNGGAWIQTPTGKVDFVYRNIDQVESVLAEGRQGIWRHDYDQQPPYGYRSVVYFGETDICVPLHDPQGEITRLKQLAAEYPEALRDRIVQEGLWGAEFSLRLCRTFADTGDVFNVAGCMTRVAHYLVHVLFALNRTYFLSDKYANRVIDQFASSPLDFTDRLAGVLGKVGRSATELHESAESLRGLWREVVGLTKGAYVPRFDLKVGLPEKRTVAESAQ